MNHTRERVGPATFRIRPLLTRRLSFTSTATRHSDDEQPRNAEEKKEHFMWRFFVSYLESSSIHGLSHLADPKRAPLEYALWLVFLALGVVGASFIGWTTIQRYQQNPTVISMQKNYQDWNTTFPSMTICPLDKFDQEKLDELLEQYKDEKVKEAVEKMLIFLSGNGSYEAYTPELQELERYFPWKPADYLHFVINMSLMLEFSITDSNEMVFAEMENWSELGHCLTYNAMVAEYNNYTYWVENRWDILTQFRIKLGNPLNGEIFTDVTTINTLPTIYFHGYNDVPDIGTRPWEVGDQKYVEVNLVIWSIYSTEETRALSVSQRRCRFLEESDLHISPVYSYNLCRMQCRARLGLELCACVPHYYRSTPRNVHWPRCSMSGYACLQKHKELLTTMRHPESGEKVQCRCLPPCDDIAFILDAHNHYAWIGPSRLKLGVTSFPRMRLKRDILFGLTDLFVSIGGTAGLFLGCSVLSFVEIFYFFTLRLFWFVRFRYKQRTTVEAPSRIRESFH